MTSREDESKMELKPCAGGVRYEWDGIAGKMRYFGSSAPNGWLGDENSPYQPVKDLKWESHPHSFPSPVWSAQNAFGFYNIEEISGSDSPLYEVRLHAHHLIAVKDGLPEAKTAAQADYELRILSALSTPSQGERVDTPAPQADVTGWKLVPIEPTLAMVMAGEEAWERGLDARLDAKPRVEYPSEERVDLASRVAYRAMINAAPSPEKPE